MRKKIKFGKDMAIKVHRMYGMDCPVCGSFCHVPGSPLRTKFWAGSPVDEAPDFVVCAQCRTQWPTNEKAAAQVALEQKNAD